MFLEQKSSKAYPGCPEAGPVYVLNSVEFAENYDSHGAGVSIAETEYVMQKFGMSYSI